LQDFTPTKKKAGMLTHCTTVRRGTPPGIEPGSPAEGLRAQICSITFRDATIISKSQHVFINAEVAIAPNIDTRNQLSWT